MGQVQYPGVMSPGGVLDIDIIPAPGGPTAVASIDDSFLDPVTEWSFEPWINVPPFAMYVQFFTAVDMVEQDHGTVVPDIAGMDSQIVAILIDYGVYDYAAFVPEDDGTFQPEFSFERWLDVQTVTAADAPTWMFEADPAQDEISIQSDSVELFVVTLTDYGVYDYDTAQPPNPEIFPESDDLMMEVWAVFEDAGVFLFTDIILHAESEDVGIQSEAIEPWTDLTAVFPADAPLWAYEADPAQDDSTFLPEFWFEPWSDVQTVTTADVPKFDYDTSQIPGVEYDPNYTVWNTWGDEPWTDQPAPPAAPTTLAIYCTIGPANPIAVTINPATSLETIMTIAGTQLTAREFDLGQLVRVRAYFRDEDGVLGDPTNVYFRMRAHAVGTTTTLTYGVDAALVKDAVGTYHTDIDTNESGGRWEWNFYSTGTGQAADHDYFQVKPTIAV